MRATSDAGHEKLMVSLLFTFTVMQGLARE
jgi:hypothetical protein